MLVLIIIIFFIIVDVEVDFVVCNVQLGYYINFVNLMDMLVLVIFVVWWCDGLFVGVILIGLVGVDYLLVEVGVCLQQ